MRSAVRVLLAIMPFTIVAGGPLGANGSPPHLLITSARVEGGVLVIRGLGFGWSPAPHVTLGGVALSPVTWVSATEVRAPMPSGTAPGTYLLTVARKPGRPPFSSFDVTIGAAGPMGPPGAKGDAGDPGPEGPPGPGLETGQVRGQLVACTPRDFDGATVYVPGRSFSVITGPTGEFELAYLAPGTYDLQAAQAGQKLIALPGVNVGAAATSDLGEVQTTKLESDPAHCGFCGNACANGYSCVAGACVCAPTTCAALGFNCGSASDGCGGTLQCGTCTGGLVCGVDAPNRCGVRETDPCFLRTPPGTRIGACP